MNILLLVGQLGYMIALPAALFAFGGALLDKRLGTSPLFILTGLFIAITSSCLMIARLLRQITESSKEEQPHA